MAKIAFLDRAKVGARPLLHSVAEEENLDAVIVLARRDGRWTTCWSSEITVGGLCMAAMKLDHDVKAFMHGADMGGALEPLPDEDA